ncbi:Long-chain-fatty-acid--CoA ligase [Pseudooceanicola marinus]|uniref:Long-chain-fatty-acid--CoA ligase n=1 Tax=Pseudooceanicola marinus TaxID=396013 RepID=A0A1X6Y8H6_9RHOB|nr:acyl-CoA synthetase [Pseudooceanicola marinus]PJE33285.1 acyl-CoA synthetase [Pseudooceanicola marinus]SLN11975.1 Long-chain-fatty-acid--CoA ligase [Pseudooceanicola marinus]
MTFTGVPDVKRIEAEMPWEARDVPKTVFGMVERTAAAFPSNKAVTFQLESGPKDKAETLSWSELKGKVAQCANMFRKLGVGENDVVALVMPNSMETVVATLGGMTAGIVNPVNPLLEPEQISAILRETGAKVVVTLKSFPKTDVAQKVAQAVQFAPNVRTVLEVDLNRYLSPPKSWIVPLIRPKTSDRHHADVLNFGEQMAGQPSELAFADSQTDRIGAYFHTGGTTGMPKVARHLHSGLVYNAWVGASLLYTEEDSIMCPLPLFHVFACHVMLMGACMSGAHVVFPTPAGYRGDGVFDNFWKLCERYKTTFIVSVPTAISALMQRPVNADISTVKLCFSGSAPLPVELFKRFEAAAGLKILEGYGLTEATCLVSCNPDQGERKNGSVGVPFPYTDVRILDASGGGEPRECAVDEVGEICVANPGVYAGSTYTEEAKNRELFHYDRYLRTGDLGRLDADGYLFITGRAKDLIIRGGHNIDPAEIEEALLAHTSVAFAGAIGQPDARTGELPCAYVELVDGAEVTSEELLAHCKVHVHERAAIPKYVEVMDELPKTAVGKVFKPALRKSAIQRVYNAALAEAGIPAEVVEVVDDKKRGLTARVVRKGEVDETALKTLLGNYTNPWEWAEDVSELA